MPPLIAAVRSFAAYLAVSLYVLVAAPIGMALALTFRWKSLLYCPRALGSQPGHIPRRHPHARRRPRASQPCRAVVFCCNHQSNIDPPILFQVLHPRLHILFKRELTQLPLLGRAFQIGGFVPIDRAQPGALDGRDRAGRGVVANGNSFLTFPEGTRSRTGMLLPFKRGPFLMALKAQVPVVPVAIHGGTASMQKGSPIVRPVRSACASARRSRRSGMDVSDREKLADEVRSRVRTVARAGTARHELRARSICPSSGASQHRLPRSGASVSSLPAWPNQSSRCIAPV